MNDLDIHLARNTPWVDMSACVKFCLDRPSRLAGHTEQKDKHIRFLQGVSIALLCKPCISYDRDVRLSVCLSVRLSVTR